MSNRCVNFINLKSNITLKDIITLRKSYIIIGIILYYPMLYLKKSYYIR